MSKVIRNIATQRPVWTSQPQIATPINPAFASRVGPILMPSLGAVTTDGVPVVISGSGYSRVATRGGVAYRHAANYIARATLPGSTFGTGVGGGLLVVFRTTTSGTDERFGAFGTEDGSVGNSVYSVGVNGAFLRITVGGSNTSTAAEFAGCAANNGNIHSCVITTQSHNSTNVQYSVAYDGKLLANNAYSGTGLGQATTFTSVVAGGAWRAGAVVSPGNGEVLLVVPFYKGGLNNAEAVSLSANPWQIFQPLARQVPFDLVRGPPEPRQSYMMGTTAPEISTAMPAAILKTPWTSQPQVPVDIDWGNPITRGLKLCLRPYAGMRDLASPSIPWVAMPGANPSKTVSKAGTGLHTLSTIVCYPHFRVDTPSQTHLLMMDWEGSDSPDSGVLAVGATPNTVSLAAYKAYDSANLRLLMGIQSANSTKLLTTLKEGAFLIKASVAGAATYDRGALVESIPMLAPITNIGGAPKVTISGDIYTDGTYVSYSTVYVYMFWDRELSDAEAKSVTANPYQIFAPQSKQIWVAP